jgi:hypothetical protein
LEVDKMEQTNEQRTKELIETIKTESKKIDITQKEKTNKNHSLQIPKDDFKKNIAFSQNVKTCTINNETNTISLNLYNGFVCMVMSDLHKSDFNTIRNSLNSTSEYIVFNRLIAKEIKNNPIEFLNRLV